MLSVRFIGLAAALASACGLLACSSDGGNGSTGNGLNGSGGGVNVDLGATPTLPAAPAMCPEFHEGMTTITSSGVSRSFMVYIDDAAAAAKDGPIVFFWYGTLGAPKDAEQALTMGGIATIKAAGGLVIAPVHNNMGTFPWIQDMDENTDFTLMDDVLACAKSKVGIDVKHIHTLGFSAGALFSASASYARGNYLASVATYSGGGMGAFMYPTNLFPAMILYGGPNDMFVLNFHDASKQFYDALTMAGHFAFACNHGLGHAIPPDAGGSVVQFFMDHPFGTNPSPYKTALPSGFPAYCSLAPLM